MAAAQTDAPADQHVPGRVMSAVREYVIYVKRIRGSQVADPKDAIEADCLIVDRIEYGGLELRTEKASIRTDHREFITVDLTLVPSRIVFVEEGQ